MQENDENNNTPGSYLFFILFTSFLLILLSLLIIYFIWRYKLFSGSIEYSILTQNMPNHPITNRPYIYTPKSSKSSKYTKFDYPSDPSNSNNFYGKLLNFVIALKDTTFYPIKVVIEQFTKFTHKQPSSGRFRSIQWLGKHPKALTGPERTENSRVKNLQDRFDFDVEYKPTKSVTRPTADDFLRKTSVKKWIKDGYYKDIPPVYRELF